MMNTRPQMTSVEERMRMPAWRSASPEKRKTRSDPTCPTIRAAELHDLAEGGDPVARDGEPGASHQRMFRISGWVARSVWVKT
jgi:hypothetical protein